ncbi:hypothetical protein [Rahnella bruchi]|uniref:hypothetical protein n=1 Tax=Rahnella bruchi TaxID=1510573 RepID=UPI0013C52135|nr:hypothetical protein [Rahnella bruchi]
MLAAEFTGGYSGLGLAENTDDLLVGKTLLHGDVLMWLIKTLRKSGCTNQRGAGQEPGRPKSWNDFKKQQLENGIDLRLLNMTFASLDRAGLCTNTHEYYFTELGKAFMRAVTGSAGDC